MSDFFHGARASQKSSASSTPVTSESGLPFVVGAAPVHMVDGAVNKPILANTYNDAVAALGYSNDWESFDLCEMMYSQFKLYNSAPVVFVNVLDPKKHKKSIDPMEVKLSGLRAELSALAIKSTVVVKDQDESDIYAVGEDYELIYDTNSGVLVLEAVESGKIAANSTVFVSYDAVDPTAVTKADIIGGFDPQSKTTSGLELIDQVFPKYLVVPDLILAPNWSEEPEVAAVMAAKADGINTLFGAHALIDADSESVTHYQDVPTWKADNGLDDACQIVCWPMVSYGGRRYHMSVHQAGVMGTVDAGNGGCPCESPSNKTMLIDSTVLKDGTEVPLDITQANYLNSMGIATALNFIGGFVAWGNYTACWPTSSDVKDYFIPVSRMFNWVAKALILTYWSKTDSKMTRRLIDSIVDAVNLWLNGLTTDEKILGGRIVFLAEENSTDDLTAGIMRFHVYLTPPNPAQEVDFILEYDRSYIESALTV